ncbi:hypothetical protein VNO80_18073 [Phaseolus coccineus]|uniref:TIR domain-containing protein n=1 Tax=Phaseolus coccineus TaxID=3886 RepID=A0AAN9MDK4_PHACN
MLLPPFAWMNSASILHCKSTGLLVIPVFFKVDPYHVSHQKGSYEEALTKHQKRFKSKKEKLQKWKVALRQVADLSGYHFQDGDGYEYKFIGHIVDWVSDKINPCRLHVADYPVGLGPQVLELRKLLNVESGDGFHMIYIHGMRRVTSEIEMKFEKRTILNFDNCKLLTRIPDVSELPNLEKLSFKECESLIEVHDSVGFLTNLKILSAEGCKKLWRFPPLNLASLEILELSFCFSLENFPEMLGKMGHIRKLSLLKLPIKELSVSFQNLPGLHQLYLDCDFVQLNSIVLTPELSELIAYNCKEWKI